MEQTSEREQLIRKTLVLVHRQPLLDQWRMQLGVFLGLEPGEIGSIGGESEI